MFSDILARVNSKIIHNYTVCKEPKPPKVYGEELEDVHKKISEVTPKARPSLEKLLDRMEKLDYSLISGDIKSKYGPYNMFIYSSILLWYIGRYLSSCT